jgi:filamentous hemagglutinin family protein
MYTRTTIALLILGIALPAHAQLIPDRSLDTEPSSTLNQSDRQLITGGARRGGNLFHSFQEFNVGESQQVYFDSPVGVDRILTRVTGTNPSRILGILGVLGNADLFLLNPNGVIFGANAQLDVKGAFVATTGDRFSFDHYEFGAIDPTAPPLLTVSAPLGIQLGQNPGAIQIQGATLVMPQSLSLIGDDLSFSGSRITANGIDLQSNTINIDQSRLRSIVTDEPGNPITIRAQRLNLLRGGQVNSISNGSGAGSDIDVAVGNRLELRGNDPSERRQVSQIFSTAEASGSGGDIRVTTDRLRLRNGGAINSLTAATGSGGDVTVRSDRSIRASGTARFSPGSGNFIEAGTIGDGRGGDVSVTTTRLSLEDGNRIQTVTWERGQGGNVHVQANAIAISGVNPQLPIWSGILTLVTGEGNGGDLTVKSDRLHIDQSGYVISAVLNNRADYALLLYPDRPFTSQPGRGNAGDVQVIADSIGVTGTSPLTPSKPSILSSITLGSGNAGDVNVTANRIALLEGGNILSSNLFSFSALGTPTFRFARGRSGDLTVNAQQIVVAGVNPVIRVGSSLGTLSGARGAGGRTTIATRDLVVRDGGSVNSGTYANGSAGRLTIDATNSIRVEGVNANGLPSSIGTFASVPDATLRSAFFLPAQPQGNTGALQIRTPQLSIVEGGEVSVQHQGIGNAGRMRIDTDILLLDQGALTAETASGRGGDINLRVDDRLQLLNGSRITANARGNNGNGGNLFINGGVIIGDRSRYINDRSPDIDDRSPNNAIVANAIGGRGGNIRIRSQGLIGLQRQDISASSQLGIDGNVVVDVLELEPIRGLEPLPDAPSDPSDQIATGCPADQEAYFAIAGRGGLPADPRQPLPGQVVLQDWREMPRFPFEALPTAPPAPPSASPALPTEAQGWRTNPAGQIELVARSAIRNSWDNQVSCGTLK